MEEIAFKDLGLIDYKEAWDYQEKLFNKHVDNKRKGEKEIIPHYLLFCEHPHVYTLGKSGNSENMLISETVLRNISATYYKTNRGGDITYHGPGQLVGYPVFDLERFELSIKDYVFKVEESIIRMLKKFDIPSSRLQGATGVWLDVDKPSARKICAIGVKAGKYVTMHGFALNVNTDLNYFTYINPCGFVDKGVTSIEKEVGKKMDIEEIKLLLLKEFEIVFKGTIIT